MAQVTTEVASLCLFVIREEQSGYVLYAGVPELASPVGLLFPALVRTTELQPQDQSGSAPSGYSVGPGSLLPAPCTLQEQSQHCRMRKCFSFSRVVLIPLE